MFNSKGAVTLKFQMLFSMHVKWT